MPIEDLMVKRFVTRSRKKKPPRRDYQAAARIPGLGDVRAAQSLKKIADATARHDSFPYPRGVFDRKKRGPTRPTPGARRQPRRD